MDRRRINDPPLDTAPPEQSPELSADWLQEIQRRSDEYDAGRMTAAPWPEVRARTRRQAGLSVDAKR
jgi:putative addiction module component (TIGR02574 family)